MSLSSARMTDSSPQAGQSSMAPPLDPGSASIGQPLAEFVNLDQRRYHCVMCRSVLRVPQQLTCGHRICEACVPRLFTGAGKGRARGGQTKIGEGEGGTEAVAGHCPGSDDEGCSEVKHNEVICPSRSLFCYT